MRISLSASLTTYLIGSTLDIRTPNHNTKHMNMYHVSRVANISNILIAAKSKEIYCKHQQQVIGAF